MNDSVIQNTDRPAPRHLASPNTRTRVMDDIVLALISAHEAERKRATLIHQAVHDLGNEIHLVGLAVKLLEGADLVNEEHTECAALMHQSVQCATTMVCELMELARLDAYEERRQIGGFDAAMLVKKVCATNGLFARERGLYLNADGPPRLPVFGDSGKLRRLVQNLLRNALKYTEHGGVSVSWGEEKDSWWFTVKDTGPGMNLHRGEPDREFETASVSDKASDKKLHATDKEGSCVSRKDDHRTSQTSVQSSEGIGLSIVKRLCDLLDASLEMASSAETGSTVRVMLPRQYQA